MQTITNEQPSSDQPRDRALPFFSDASYAELSEILSLPKCGSRRTANALAAIVAGMAHHVRMKPEDMWISYSRNRDTYAGQDFYYGPDWGYATILGAVDMLEADGWFAEHDRRLPGQRGFQSRFRPNAAKFNGVSMPKSRPDGRAVRLRDRETKELVAYRETEKTARMVSFVTKIKAHLSSADIEFDGGLSRDGDVVRFEKNVVDLGDRQLYRVFSGDWKSGGRFYGAWQSIPKDERASGFRIDGRRVGELDYKNNHPALLYAREGIALNPSEDCYDIAGYEDQRTACKRALNILINARHYGEAIGAVAQHVKSGSYAEAVDLIEAVKERHAPISHYFHSDAGVKLQKMDADMCEDVLREMTIKRGETVIPVHDSFIVRQDVLPDLEKVMSEVAAKAALRIRNICLHSVICGNIDLHTVRPLPRLRPGPCSSGAAGSDSCSTVLCDSESARARKTSVRRVVRKTKTSKATGRGKREMAMYKQIGKKSEAGQEASLTDDPTDKAAGKTVRLVPETRTEADASSRAPTTPAASVFVSAVKREMEAVECEADAQMGADTGTKVRNATNTTFGRSTGRILQKKRGWAPPPLLKLSPVELARILESENEIRRNMGYGGGCNSSRFAA